MTITIIMQALVFALLVGLLAYFLFRIWMLETRLDSFERSLDELRQDPRRLPVSDPHDLDGEDFAEWTEDLGSRRVPIDRKH